MRVREAAVPAGWWGVYDHRYRLITLKPGLGLAQRRSTLAHELGHAAYGHHGHHPKTERIADRWAARSLLSVDMVISHARIAVETRELSANMDVMPWVLDAFVDSLTDQEFCHILNQLQQNS